MPSQDIVRSIRTITQKQLAPAVPKHWKEQFQFGMQAYGLKPFQSAAGNACSVVSNPNTAATKTERLLSNERLASHCGSLFDELYQVKPRVATFPLITVTCTVSQL